MLLFTKSDVLKTSRGYQGGYMLAKDPRECTVGDILRITEGSLAVVPCVEQDPIECKRSADCAVLPMWRGLYKVINEYLDSVSLQDILDQQKERSVNDYVI